MAVTTPLPQDRALEAWQRYHDGLADLAPRVSIKSLANTYGTSERAMTALVKGPRPEVPAEPEVVPAAPAPADTDTDGAAPALDLGAAIRELVARGGLHEFIRTFWQEPQAFHDNWHIGAMCEYLEAVTRGEIKRLVINVPPGHMKSLTCGVFWPAWMWAQDGGRTQMLAGSFDKSLLNNQSEKLIGIVQSPEYVAAWPEVRLKNQAPAMGEFKLAKGGFRFNTSPEGKGTGRHVDGLLIDDPMKPQDAILARESAFRKVDTWFDGTLQTRTRKWIVVIMQRVHTNDLAGRCIAEGYESLILPARQVKRTMWARDPRTEPGELLWPSLFPEERVRAQEIKLKGEASAQLQQDPTPATGGFIEEPWTRIEWIEPPKRGRWCSSWDFSSKSAEESHSKVAGQLWCATRDLGLVREYLSELNDRLAKVPGAHGDVRIRPLVQGETYYCLVDWVGGWWNYVTSKAQFVMAHNRPLWRQHAKVKLIEEKANGIALISEFKDKFIGIKAIEPEGDKEERTRVHTEKWELGQVIYCPGSDPVREEHVKFPKFSWDDQLDATTQALDYLANKNARYRENLRRIASRGGGLL